MSQTSNQPRRPFAVIVLAAGKSTRMRSKTPKALHEIAGKPLLAHILNAVEQAGAAKIVIVVGHQADEVKKAFGDKYEYARQEQQRGTGHAVGVTRELLHGWEGPVVVLPGDAPLITAEAILALLDHHGDRSATLLTVRLTNPTGYGRIVRGDDGSVERIVEEKDADGALKAITEVSVSVYAFSPGFLYDSLSQITTNNAQGEYYLTDTAALAADRPGGLSALTWPDSHVGLGINTRAELAAAAKLLNQRILRGHMDAGVTVVDPDSTWIDASVRIGMDTTIQPFTIISGVTDIGEDCAIGPGARISHSNLGNKVTVRDSTITSSEIGDGTTIGPFANLRPGSIIGRSVKIGDFVETKQTTLHDGVSAGHFAYLGNATIGAGTNIGAGTITCNYDGDSKHETNVGANAFIGSNSTLVAPVTINDGAFVAAGSTITDDVPKDALAIGRGRQVIKPDWAARKRQERAKNRANAPDNR